MDHGYKNGRDYASKDPIVVGMNNAFPVILE